MPHLTGGFPRCTDEDVTVDAGPSNTTADGSARWRRVLEILRARARRPFGVSLMEGIAAAFAGLVLVLAYVGPMLPEAAVIGTALFFLVLKAQTISPVPDNSMMRIIWIDFFCPRWYAADIEKINTTRQI